MTPLPACKWRGEATCPHRFSCNSPLLHAPSGVSAEFCARCPAADKDLPPRLANRTRRAAPPLPGAELKALLASLGLAASGGDCGCDDRARLMDSWGVEGCAARREEILGWLRARAAALSWAETIKAAALSVKAGIAIRLNPFDPAPGLLDEAIRRCSTLSPSGHNSPSPPSTNSPTAP